MKNQFRNLFEAAQASQKMSHSPYSRFSVGAALRTDTGTVFSGCNVENASYGATICAERTAILKMVSEVGAQRVTDMLVLTNTTPPSPPCGQCLQVIGEFSDDNTMIHLANPQGDINSFSLKELFPFRFRFD